VAFVDPYNRTGIGQIWAVDVVSGAKRAIVTQGDAIQPSWSPHGKRIAYWGLKLTSGGQRDIGTAAADGSDASRGGVLATDDSPLDWNPVWSPDGRFLYFPSDRGGSMNLLARADRRRQRPRVGSARGGDDATSGPAR
jgi:Tol biopolymer transport system component